MLPFVPLLYRHFAENVLPSLSLDHVPPMHAGICLILSIMVQHDATIVIALLMSREVNRGHEARPVRRTSMMLSSFSILLMLAWVLRQLLLHPLSG